MTNRTYTVRYRDSQSNPHEITTNAKDSYDAKKKAMSCSDFLSSHPNLIDSIVRSE